MNRLCHSRACEINITNCDREVMLFIIRCLMSRGDKRRNKNVTTDRATVAIIPRHRYRVVCALSIFLDLVPRGEGMNYLDILFSPIRPSPSLPFLPHVHRRLISSSQVSRDKSTFSINFSAVASPGDTFHPTETVVIDFKLANKSPCTSADFNIRLLSIESWQLQKTEHVLFSHI